MRALICCAPGLSGAFFLPRPYTAATSTQLITGNPDVAPKHLSKYTALAYS